MKFKKRMFYILCSILAIALSSSIAVAGYRFWSAHRCENELCLIKKGLPGIEESRNLRVIRQVQAAVNARSSFKFAVFGDTHDNVESFKKLAYHAAAQNADFILHTGDFTNSGRLKEYLNTLECIDQLKIPVIMAPGNHDMDNYGFRIYSRVLGPPNFYFDLQGARFFVLNNVTRDIDSDLENAADDHHDPGLSRGIDRQTINSIESLLRSGNGQTFFVMHMPPPLQPFEADCFSRNGENFIDLMTRYAPRIGGVFFGHIHGYCETKYKEVPYLLCGAAGVEQEHRYGDEVNTDKSYVMLTVADGRIAKNVYFIDRPQVSKN